MKKYNVIIEETSVQEFEIYAEDHKQALELSKENYKKGLIVLDAGEVHSKKIAVKKSNDNITELVEF